MELNDAQQIWLDEIFFFYNIFLLKWEITQGAEQEGCCMVAMSGSLLDVIFVIFHQRHANTKIFWMHFIAEME